MDDVPKVYLSGLPPFQSPVVKTGGCAVTTVAMFWHALPCFQASYANFSEFAFPKMPGHPAGAVKIGRYPES